MRILNALIIVLLLLLSGNAFGFACAGVTDFSQEIGFADTVHAEELSLLSEIKNGFVLEASGNKLIKFAESVPIAIQIASGQKGKIYYALSTKENFYSSEDYPEKNVFTWVDGKGTSFLDGVKKSAAPKECDSWNKQTDALELDLSLLDSSSVLTAFTVPRDSYFVLLCAPSDVTISVHYLDGSGGYFKAGKGIFNSGKQSMIPIGVYSRQQQAFPSDFVGFAKEKISEKKACVSGSSVNWNLNALIKGFPGDLTELAIEKTEPTASESGVLENDSDDDGVPDSTDKIPGVPDDFSNGTDYSSLASGSESLLVFMPVQWAGSESFEKNVDEMYNYFMEKSGLSGCKNVSKLVLSESDVRGCGLESIQLECVHFPSALGLIEKCARQKAGIALNSKGIITIGMTDFLGLSVKQNIRGGTECIRAPAFTGPMGSTESILTSTEAPYQLAHEIGHVWFYFCDQYSIDAFLYQNSFLYEHYAFFGCGNKWPGPYEYFDGEVKIEHLYEAVLTYSDIQQDPSFIPSECKDYDRCPNEKGKTLTCCPNIFPLPGEEANCTGRFIPLSNGKNAASIMGPVLSDTELIRDFDCFEKSTIKAVTGC